MTVTERQVATTRPTRGHGTPRSDHAPASTTTRPGGGWHPGDATGTRRFARIGDVALERGGMVPDVTVAYETWGTLNTARDNVILIEHALTGDSHVEGEAGGGHASPGWWPGLIGPGRPIDTADWFVVAANVLGGCQGSTGPSSLAPDGRPWGSRFPYVTIRDQVDVEARLLAQLGIPGVAAVIGGSMGGMRAIEWAASYPEQVARCVVLASTACATADQIAWCQPQLLAIRQDPDFAGGDYYESGRHPDAGLGLARRIAHITYRTSAELDERFGRAPQLGEDPLTSGARGRFAVESYLDHHAGKLARRFDANSYLVLTESMNSHDVGRDRGGVASALARVTAQCTIASVDTDRLYPPRLSDELHEALPRSVRAHITSLHGHDGFLIEAEQVGRIISAALATDTGDGTATT